LGVQRARWLPGLFRGPKVLPPDLGE